MHWVALLSFCSIFSYSFWCLRTCSYYLLVGFSLFCNLYWWLLPSYLDLLVKIQEWSVFSISVVTHINRNSIWLRSRFLVPIMVDNICLMHFPLTSLSMVFSIKLLVPVLPSKMGLLRERSDISLRSSPMPLFYMHVPQIFWTNALQTTAYLMNRMPSRILRFKCPFELLSCSTLGSFLPSKVFGCICYVYVPKSNCSKLTPRLLNISFLSMLWIRDTSVIIPFAWKCIVSMESPSMKLFHFSLLAILIFKVGNVVYVKMRLFFLSMFLYIPLILMDIITRENKRLLQTRQILLKKMMGERFYSYVC